MEVSHRLIQRDPEAAHKRLRALFAKHDGNLQAVAEQLGYHRESVVRWIAMLIDEGYEDPRDGRRGRPGRKVDKVASRK